MLCRSLQIVNERGNTGRGESGVGANPPRSRAVRELQNRGSRLLGLVLVSDEATYELNL